MSKEFANTTQDSAVWVVPNLRCELISLWCWRENESLFYLFSWLPAFPGNLGNFQFLIPSLDIVSVCRSAPWVPTSCICCLSQLHQTKELLRSLWRYRSQKVALRKIRHKWYMTESCLGLHSWKYSFSSGNDPGLTCDSSLLPYHRINFLLIQRPSVPVSLFGYFAKFKISLFRWEVILILLVFCPVLPHSIKCSGLFTTKNPVAICCWDSALFPKHYLLH